MPTFITRSGPLANGTYSICAQGQNACITLTNGTEDTTLTTWAPSANDAEQQWQILSDVVTGATYTIQNVQHSKFASYSPAEQADYMLLFGSQTPFSWQIRGSAGTYQFSNDSTFTVVWSTEHYTVTDGDTVELYPLAEDNSGYVWILTAVNTSTSATPTSSTSTGLPSATAGANSGGGLSEADTIATAFGALGILIAILGLWLTYLGVKHAVPSWLGWICCHRRTKRTKDDGDGMVSTE